MKSKGVHGVRVHGKSEFCTNSSARYLATTSVNVSAKCQIHFFVRLNQLIKQFIALSSQDNRTSLSMTYQPDDNGVVAHLGSGVQGSHSVIGPDAGFRTTVFHKVLDDFQVTLLAGQVERCGTILSLRVDKTVGDENNS